MNLGKRIERRLSELGWERKDLIRRVPELTPQSLSALITRDSRRSEHDVRIASALGVNLVWLNSGDGPKLSDRESSEAEDIITVPLADSTPDAQRACILPVQKGLSLRKAWLDVTLGHDKDLCVVPISGQSMEPTFSAGDLLLVDQSIQRIADDGIYLFQMNGMDHIKRLQQRPDGSVLLLSDNNKYEPFIVNSECLGELTILGRAVYAWSGIKL